MRKKVFIALRMAGIAGQEKLSGIFRYLGEKHDWDITLVRTAAEFTPSRLKTALKEDYDGFIVSTPGQTLRDQGSSSKPMITTPFAPPAAGPPDQNPTHGNPA